MEKIRIKSFPMVSPTPIVLVGADVDGKSNYAAVGAFGVVCLEPVFYVSLKSTHHTTAGVMENGYFSVNIPSAEMVSITDYCGMVTGETTDKSNLFTSFYDELGKAPMISEAPMNFLCKVMKSVTVSNFEVFFGEIVSTFIGEQFLTDGKPDPLKIDPVFGMGPQYYSIGKCIGNVFQEGKKVKTE